MSFFTRFIRKIVYPDSYTGEAFIKALRNKYHIDIGEGCTVWSPNQVHIDTTRPHMLHIGNLVKITRNVTILCHDYSRSVWCEMHKAEYGNIGEAAVTWIGDNVFIGVNATILMGAHIGSNSIVGAGAVVSGKFPNEVVIAGNPARVICTIGELYEKRKMEEVESAKLYAKEWKKKFKRYPDIYEMTNAFAWLYLPHTQESIEKYPEFFNLSGVEKYIFCKKFIDSQPVFDSFQKFLEECEKRKI